MVTMFGGGWPGSLVYGWHVKKGGSSKGYMYV